MFARTSGTGRRCRNPGHHGFHTAPCARRSERSRGGRRDCLHDQRRPSARRGSRRLRGDRPARRRRGTPNHRPREQDPRGPDPGPGRRHRHRTRAGKGREDGRRRQEQGQAGRSRRRRQRWRCRRQDGQDRVAARAGGDRGGPPRRPSRRAPRSALPRHLSIPTTGRRRSRPETVVSPG